MNDQLLEVAQTAVAQCEVEQLSEDDTLHMTIDALIRYARQQRMIGEEVSREMRAALEQVAREAMNNEPTMVRCPYCRQMHDPAHVSTCPLRS